MLKRILNAYSRAIFGSTAPGAATNFNLDAARTDRMNKKHWELVKDESINSILSRELTVYRARANHVALNDPIVKGMVKTYQDDIVGPTGPALQVQSDDEVFNKALEEVWADWWQRPDVNGVLSGADILGLSMKSLWTAGDYLWQIVTDRGAGTEIKTRILMIDPRRLAQPLDRATDPNVLMGIRRTPTGKPIAYYIEEALKVGSPGFFPIKFATVPAKFMVHGFEVLVVGQIRGMPWLTASLPAVADLTEYEQQVMDAARMAAAMSVLLFTKAPDEGAPEIQETIDLERGTMSTLPPGYEATQISPTQPPNIYKEFINTHRQKIGRPVGMPLLTVNLDAKGHSWSSARLDRMVYHAGIRVQQGNINRTGLNRLVDVIAREAQLAGLVPIPRAGLRIKYDWKWPAFTSIDPLKEAKASTERLKNRTSTLKDECADRGRDSEEIIKQQGVEKKALEKDGVVAVPAPAAPIERQPSPPTAPVPPQSKSPNENGKQMSGRLSVLGVGP